MEENEIKDGTEKEKIVCLKCGTELEEQQKFCPKCGTEKGATNNKTCSKCGTVLNPGEKFCSNCGEKAKLDVQSDIVDKAKDSVKKMPNKTKGIIGISIAVVIALVVFTITAAPKLFVSVDTLLAEGNYEKAYKKANKDVKEDILTENLLATISYDASEALKDPSSFVLRDAWYDKSKQKIVLYVNGNNSYGASVTGYWYYTFDKDENKYTLFTSLSDLDDEKTYSWDTYSDRLEKVLKNLARTAVKKMIADDSMKVKKESIENINNLFKNDLLDDIKLLKENQLVTSKNLKDSDKV